MIKNILYGMGMMSTVLGLQLRGLDNTETYSNEETSWGRMIVIINSPTKTDIGACADELNVICGTPFLLQL